MLVSVPVENSMSDGLWYGRLRTIRGVIDSTSSDLPTVSLLLPNKPAQPGNIAEARNLVAGRAVVVAHQAGEDLRFAVVQTQRGLRVAGVDLHRDRALAGRLQRRGVTHFQGNLDRHFVVQVHGRRALRASDRRPDR